MKKYIFILVVMIAMLSISIYNKLQAPITQRPLEKYNPDILTTSQQQYSRFSGEQSQLSGLFDGTGDLDIWTILHFPTGKYKSLYLSGNNEAWVLILQDTGKNIDFDTHSLTGDIINTFYHSSKYPKKVTSTLVGGDRGYISLFELPYLRNRPSSTTLVAFLSKKDQKIFRELTNKETLLISEGGIVSRYLKGSSYTPDDAGIDIEQTHTIPIGGLQHKISQL